MAIFGKKKDLAMTPPEVADFSNDTWSFKGDAPVYQIQSDGFTYDVVDADGNDKNAISLGISGMLIIVLNSKSPKIREDELLPHFGKVIKTRNWHSMTVKEANSLVQIAIKKLSSSATSGDVFDLASYAPLEVKRVLLKTLFTISRTQLNPEFREEAEHRIIDDIVPGIFATPEYELALLTGLIVKPDAKPKEQNAQKLTTAPVLDPDPHYSRPLSDDIPPFAITGSDSAFAELQRIYGGTPAAAAAAAGSPQPNAEVKNNAPAPSVPDAAPQPLVPQQASPTQNMPNPQTSVPASQPAPQPVSQSQQGGDQSDKNAQPSAAPFAAPQPAKPFAHIEPKNIPQPQMPNFSGPVPNNPFAQAESRSIPQQVNFGTPQPNNPFVNGDVVPSYQQPGAGIPQPPAPGFGMQQNAPYGNMNAQNGAPLQQGQGYPQGYPYQGNFQPYPQQGWPQNPQNAQGIPNQGPQQPFYPGQMRPQYSPMPQNMGGAYPQQGWPQNPDGSNPQWMNPARNPQQPPAQSDNTAENA